MLLLQAYPCCKHDQEITTWLSEWRHNGNLRLWRTQTTHIIPHSGCLDCEMYFLPLCETSTIINTDYPIPSETVGNKTSNFAAHKLCQEYASNHHSHHCLGSDARCRTRWTIRSAHWLQSSSRQSLFQFQHRVQFWHVLMYIFLYSGLTVGTSGNLTDLAHLSFWSPLLATLSQWASYIAHIHGKPCRCFHIFRGLDFFSSFSRHANDALEARNLSTVPIALTVCFPKKACFGTVAPLVEDGGKILCTHHFQLI